MVVGAELFFPCMVLYSYPSSGGAKSCRPERRHVKMGIPYNYKWNLDFLVLLYWDPEVRFAIKKWGPSREKGIPERSCFEPKRGKMQVNYFIALF